MFDINAIITEAIRSAVAEAIDKQIIQMQQNHLEVVHALSDRIADLEADNTMLVQRVQTIESKSESRGEAEGCTRGEYLEMQHTLSVLEHKVQNLADEFDQTENDFRQDVVQNIADAVQDNDEDMLEAIADAIKAVFEKGMMTVTVDRI